MFSQKKNSVSIFSDRKRNEHNMEDSHQAREARWVK